jgi:hypothetical protein
MSGSLRSVLCQFHIEPNREMFSKNRAAEGESAVEVLLSIARNVTPTNDPRTFSVEFPGCNRTVLCIVPNCDL